MYILRHYVYSMYFSACNGYLGVVYLTLSPAGVYTRGFGALYRPDLLVTLSLYYCTLSPAGVYTRGFGAG